MLAEADAIAPEELRVRMFERRRYMQEAKEARERGDAAVRSRCELTCVVVLTCVLLWIDVGDSGRIPAKNPPLCGGSAREL